MREEIQQRMSNKKGLYATDADWCTQTMEDCLLSADRVLLESILYSNLALDKRNSGKLAGIYSTLNARHQSYSSRREIVAH